MIQVRRSDLRRVVVAIDPAATHGEDADDTGIITVARGPCQPSTCVLTRQGLTCPGHGYVLADSTCNVPPAEWAARAIADYDTWGGSRIVAERNNGGDMVGYVVQSARPGIPYTSTYATHGKFTRAEPASAMSEQGRIHLLGVFPKLEEELTTWTPDAKWSPNRLDALVWGLWELRLIGGQGAAFMAAWQSELEGGKTANLSSEQAKATLQQLPSLDTTTATHEEHVCRCPRGQRRFFDGRCTSCNGVPPNAG